VRLNRSRGPPAHKARALATKRRARDFTHSLSPGADRRRGVVSGRPRCDLHHRNNAEHRWRCVGL